MRSDAIGGRGSSPPSTKKEEVPRPVEQVKKGEKEKKKRRGTTS